MSAVGLTKASLLRRLLARLIDVGVTSVFLFPALILYTYVLPKYVAMIAKIGGTMPWPTKVLIFLFRWPGAITAQLEGFDILVTNALMFVLTAFPLSVVFGIPYLLVKDSLASGQSLGKRAMGLMTVETGTGIPCSVARSLMRNATDLLLSLAYLAAVTLVGSRENPGAIVVIALLLSCIWLFELPVAFLAPGGRRLADWLAGTRVVEARAMSYDADATHRAIESRRATIASLAVLAVLIVLMLALVIVSVIMPYLAILSSFGSGGTGGGGY